MQQKLKIAALLTLAFVANATAIFGQNIFQKRSDLNYSFDMFTSVFSTDTGFFALGQAIGYMPLDSSNNHSPERRLTTTWYNWNGNIVKEKSFVKNKTDYYSMWYSSNTIYNNGFYYFGSIVDSLTLINPNTSDIFIAKFNFDGDTLWSKRYDSGNFDNGSTALVSDNGDCIGVGYSILPDGKNATRLLRIDSLGNVTGNYTFPSTYGNSARYCIKDNLANFYISGQATINNVTGSNPKNIRVMLLKVDSWGSQVWMKFIPGICNDYSGGIAFAPDGNILMTNLKCYDQPAGNVIRSRFALYKLNSNSGDTIWHKEYPIQYNNTEHPNFIRALNNGDILLGGEGIKLFYENGDTTFGKRTGVLIRTDSLGNMKWQRYYFYNTNDAQNMVESYLTDGKQTPDGGFILVGRTTHASDFDDGWIIKTDENGCIDLSCVNGIEELDDEDFRLFIYPNPAEEYVSIDLPIMYNKGTLQIYTMQGQLVKSDIISTGGTQNFNISDMPNGIYQLVVYSATNKLLGRQKLVVAR